MEKLVRVVKFIFTLSPNRLLVTNSVWAFTPTSPSNYKREDTIATTWHPLPYLNHTPKYTIAPLHYRGGRMTTKGIITSSGSLSSRGFSQDSFSSMNFTTLRKLCQRFNILWLLGAKGCRDATFFVLPLGHLPHRTTCTQTPSPDTSDVRTPPNPDTPHYPYTKNGKSAQGRKKRWGMWGF